VRILFIDDDKSFLGSLQAFFENNQNVGFARAQSIDEAWSAILTHEPELVFLDHNLSHRNGEGMKVMWRLRKEKPHVFVVSTTGCADASRAYKSLGVPVMGKASIISFDLYISRFLEREVTVLTC